MIGFSIADMVGGEPIGEIDMGEDIPRQKPVGSLFHVHTAGGKVLEQVIATDAVAALDMAKDLLGEVDGLYVTGPHDAAAPAKI